MLEEINIRYTFNKDETKFTNLRPFIYRRLHLTTPPSLFMKETIYVASITDLLLLLNWWNRDGRWKYWWEESDVS